MQSFYILFILSQVYVFCFYPIDYSQSSENIMGTFNRLFYSRWSIIDFILLKFWNSYNTYLHYHFLRCCKCCSRKCMSYHYLELNQIIRNKKLVWIYPKWLNTFKIFLISWNLPVEHINTTAKTNTRLQMVQGFRSMKKPNK